MGSKFVMTDAIIQAKPRLAGTYRDQRGTSIIEEMPVAMENSCGNIT